MTTTPNFFIIGAPKCGTTAMSEYLRTHPNVFMSDPKEPNFFAEDIGPRRFRAIDEYLNLFAHATPDQLIVAEASTFYIHSDHAVDRIRGFRPDAKLLVMLRRPVDMIYSYHAQLLRSGFENIWDFEKAWELQTTRAAGKAMPPGIKPRELNYRWMGSLGTQVDRVLQIYPRQQVHFIVFDDFSVNTRAEYIRLLAFLEIPDDGRVEFPRIYEGQQFKSRFAARLPRYLRAKLGATRVNATKRALGIRQWGIVRAFDKFNAETSPRPPLRPEFRRYLEELFDPEVALLEKLLGRELPHWRSYQPRQSPVTDAALSQRAEL
jgi:hypothetical protein